MKFTAMRGKVASDATVVAWALGTIWLRVAAASATAPAPASTWRRVSTRRRCREGIHMRSHGISGCRHWLRSGQRDRTAFPQRLQDAQRSFRHRRELGVRDRTRRAAAHSLDELTDHCPLTLVLADEPASSCSPPRVEGEFAEVLDGGALAVLEHLDVLLAHAFGSVGEVADAAHRAIGKQQVYGNGVQKTVRVSHGERMHARRWR